MPDRELNYMDENKNIHNEQEITPEERDQIERHEKLMADKLEFENQKAERWNFKENK
jgi:hypothetical protein